MSIEYTPEHAAKALEIVERWISRVSKRKEYAELVAILGKPNRWRDAHELFDRIRVNITLPAERSESESLDHYFIYVAENAAKTAYNCSGESAPFDDDSFEWLLKCEQELKSRAEKKG